MKCVYCGQERATEPHYCSGDTEFYEQAKVVDSLDNICLVLRDILEELKIRNELEGK